jgi:O-Antigen ligase
LLIPLALSAFWASASGVSRFGRCLLVVGTVVCGFTLVLSYVRFDLAVGVVTVICALLVAPTTRVARGIGVLAITVAGVAFTFGVTTSGYLAKLTSTNASASGAARLRSIADGLRTMASHPLAGVGLGRYHPGGTLAHSAIAQAGAETSVLGLLALGILTAWVAQRAGRAIRQGRLDGIAPAASIAAGAYALCAALTSGASLGLAFDFVPIWALSVVLMIVASEHRSSLSTVSDLGRSLGPVDLHTATPGWTSRLSRFPGAHPALPAALAGGALASLGILTLHPGADDRSGGQAATDVRTPNTPVPQFGKVWTFRRRLPTGWSSDRETTVTRTSGAVRVTTGGGPFTYQPEGPTILLAPGTYRLEVDAKVLRRGLAASVLDVERNAFLSTLRVPKSGRLVNRSVQVTATRKTFAEVIVSDFRTTAKPSVGFFAALDCVLDVHEATER